MSPLVGAVIEPLAVAVHGVSCAEIEKRGQGSGRDRSWSDRPVDCTCRPRPRSPQSRHQRYSALSDSIGEASSASKAVNAGAEIKDLVDSETSGDGADLVFECVGAPDSIREMTGLVRSRGKIVNLGVCKSLSKLICRQ